jgi:DNA polymerase (family 10)
MSEDIEFVRRERGLTDIPGVGKSSAEKIEEYLNTGNMKAYQELMNDFPEDALEMLAIPDVGPKTVGRLMKEKGITSLDQLEKAIDGGELEGMDGIGEKTIENMRSGIEVVKKRRGRISLGHALPVACEMMERLRKIAGLKAVEIAGSLRRRRETIGDVDLLAAVDSREGVEERGEEIIKAFTNQENVAEVIAAGVTRGSIRTDDGLQVDLRVVSESSFGAALQYFTGSKAHNVKIRGMAGEKGLKINEYGVFNGDEKVAGGTEEEVYGAVGLPFISPELREDRGEIEAASEGKLPVLIKQGDLMGELHCHTNYSDGNMSVEDIANAARGFGYSYVALTDHSKNLGVASGLNEAELEERNRRIDELNAGQDDFLVLKGTEVDILSDGSLDYSDEVLAGLDWVIASVHDHFNMSEAEMTRRIVAAIRNPHVHAIGHLTGRLINRREPYPVNIPEVIEACRDENVFLELNAHPDRLDITDLVCREAKKAGVRVAIGSDAHTADQLSLISFGVDTARRGWLEKGDVVNCLSAEELLELLDGK